MFLQRFGSGDPPNCAELIAQFIGASHDLVVFWMTDQ